MKKETLVLSSIKDTSNERAPWLNPDGTEKTTEQIKDISSSWSKQTWDEYLFYLESPREESLLDRPEQLDQVSVQEFTFMMLQLAEGREFSLLDKVVAQKALRCLSTRQRQIIEMIYWKNEPISLVAKKLGVSRRTVRSGLDRGLEKMRELLESGEVLENLKRIFSDSPEEKSSVNPSFLGKENQI